MADRYARDEIETARRWVSAPPRNYVPSSAEIPRLREVIFAALDALDEVERLRALRAAVRQLLAESRGVVGFHLNGDIATWDEVFDRETLAVIAEERDDG